MTGGLRAAVEDRAGRDRRRKMVTEFAGWWGGEGGAGPLHDALDALPSDVGPGDVLAAVQPWLDDIGWIAAMVRRTAVAMRADPLFEAPFRIVSHETQNGLRLLTHPLVTVTVLQIPADRLGQRKRAALGERSIAFTGAASRLRVVRSGGAVLDLWTNDAAQPCLAAAEAGRCRPAGQRSLREGETVAFDGARQAWTIGRAGADIVLVHAVARIGVAPLMLEYDVVGGGFVAATMTDAAAARMQLLAGLLGHMERVDAVPVLAELIGEAPFHLRWEAMRQLMALDAVAALPLLRGMAEADLHAEIRAAARLTLDRIAA